MSNIKRNVINSAKSNVVEMAHGNGGRAMAEFIDTLFIAAFNNGQLNQKTDASCFHTQQGRMVMTTDGHVISPLFFPGGNIGSLSIHGTINDIAMMGALPRYISCGFILEESYPLSDLSDIVLAMAKAAKEANVEIITGDTKVVEKGKADGVFITTTGIGELASGINISPQHIHAGDKIIVNGSLGDHGISILAQRNTLGFETSLQSDSASLSDLVQTILASFSTELHCLRDPTRGGLAATLNELAQQSKLGFSLDEDAIPIKDEVDAACELLGLDPLYIANEGKFVAFCSAYAANDILSLIKQHPLGKEAAIIGEVTHDPRYLVELTTPYGGKRIVHWRYDDQLPRIC